MVYWLVNGQERSYGKIIMSFEAEKFRIEIDGPLTEEGTLKGLDPTQSPKAFDYAPHMLNGRPVQLSYPAIYLLEGDVFVACVGYAGARPKAFSAEAGSENELVIYKRLTPAPPPSAVPH